MSKFTEFISKMYDGVDAPVYLQDDISDYIGDSEILEYFKEHISTEDKLEIFENSIDYEFSAKDKARLLKYLVQDISSSGSYSTSYFYNSVLKLITNYYSLSPDEESSILKIADKYIE